MRRWIYDTDGKPKGIDETLIQSYMNSDTGGKEYKVGQLFAYVKLMMDTIERMHVEMAEMKAKIEKMEAGR